MATSAERIRQYRGPAVLSYGFRPFFLAGAAWAFLAMGLWLLMLTGAFEPPTAMSPIEWHIHELLYGYVPAVVAGFLLTAVPNWTGGLPITGKPLLALFAPWLAGRLAVLFSSAIGAATAAAIDLLFLAALCAVIGREIIAGRDMRNLKVLIVVIALLIGNGVFHAEALLSTGDGYGVRIGIAATIFLIMLIGGRVIPSFTRNWLARRQSTILPVSFNRYDIVVMAVSAIALAGWTVLPNHSVTAAWSAAAALMNAIRMARWAGYRTLAEPLVLVLHVAYAFVPFGFALLAIGSAGFDAIPQTAAIHAWTAGAMATMTLAVMSRASLGHTGRELTATGVTKLLYIAVFVAAVLRISAAFDGVPETVLQVSGAAWIAAFGAFVIHYGPMLMRPAYRR